MIKKWQNIFLKGLSAVLLSLLSLIFIGISSANASATPLVKCDFEGSTPLICSGATSTVSSINTGSPINGLASAYATWDGGITQRIDFNTPLTVATSGFSVAFQLKRTSDPGSWWFTGGLRLSDNTLLNFSSQYPWYSLQNFDWETANPTTTTYWVIGNYGPTTVQWYNNNEVWGTSYYSSNNWNYIDYSDDKPNNFEFYSQNYPVLYDDFQVFDHILSETERQQLVDTGNITPPEPPAPTNSYILYYGNHPYYVSINATATFPVVYNICQEWDETKTYQLLLTETASSSPITQGAALDLTECSGSKYIEFNTGEDEDFYIANIKIREIETQTTIVETDNIYFAIVSTIETSGNMIEFITESPLNINRTGYGTTTVLSFVQMLSEEIATDNEICLITEKGEKSENCINAETGIAYREITIDIPQYDTTQIIKLGLYDENDNLLMTSNSPVMLVIYASFYDTDTWIDQFSSSSIPSFLGLNSAQLACSEEEWLDTSFSQTMQCAGKKFIFDVVFIIEKLIRSFYSTVVNVIKNIFPFSILTSVNESWIRAATKNLPPDITWIAPEGDLVFTVPANWTGQGTTTEVIAFGDSIFKTGDNSIAIFFERVRALSKYLIMAGLVWSFIQFGTYFYWKHLAEEKKE